jgi:hypothetical protein
MNLKQLRSHRIFGIAIFDLVLSVIGMIVIFLIAKNAHFKQLKTWPFILAAILLAIPVGIVSHILVGTNTNLNYKLGLSYRPAN